MLPVFTRPRGSMNASFSTEPTRNDLTASARAEALPFGSAPPAWSMPLVPSPAARPFIPAPERAVLATDEDWAGVDDDDLVNRFVQRVGPSFGGGCAGRSSACTGSAGASPAAGAAGSPAAASSAGLPLDFSSSDAAALLGFASAAPGLGRMGRAGMAGTGGRGGPLAAFVGVTVDGVATRAG